MATISYRTMAEEGHINEAFRTKPYLVWFAKQGFPEGKLGQQLALMYEIKLNGMESMLTPLIDND